MNSIHNNTDPSSSGLAEGNGQEELDFPYLFIYNQPCDEYPQDETAGDAGIAPHYDVLHPFPGGQHGSPHLFSSGGGALEYEAVDLRELLGGQGRSLSPQPWGGPPPPPAPPPPPPSASPRIEITCSEKHHQHRDLVPTAPVDIDRRPTLTVPGYELMAYREACLSPASSNSSTSWQSDICSPLASPCVSLGNGGSPRTSPTGSPCAGVAEDAYLGRRASLTSSSSRPGSRSTSPQGKRTYAMYENPGLARPRSRSPSPHFACEHQTALPQDDELYGARSRLEELANTPGYVQAKAVPTKMVRPNQEYAIYRQSQAQHSGFLCDLEVKREAGLETLYVVQPQLLPGICSLPPTSLPPLDRPLPSRTEQYELCVEVQPRAHHRAHYETEGSRGAVKAHSGGHPVVQLRGYSGTDPLGLQVFIGTSDDRPMRPHAFYQVHRITGKTVSTRSQERMLYGTKVLELPLEPKENMRAVIDCAGILKLKNADIELRKGETHVGRKNTRVRMVFRVHVPKGGGHFLSLQVDSQPIECSQRSAHELPAVERQDVECCSVLGGIQMILTGQNFTSDSRVVFTEKTHVGQQIWEAEATVDRDKSQASMLFVEVPPYRDPKIYHPVKVNFHVRNSKGKRSQPQHFTYTPLSVSLIKAEPFDEFQFGQLGCAVSQILGVSSQPCRHANQTAYGGACASSDGPASLVIYPPAVQYQLQYPPGHYASHAHGLAASPPLGPYQPLAEHAMPGVSPGTEQQRPAPTPLARPHFGPSSYRPQGGPQLAEQRHVFAGDSYKAAASQFLTLDMSDLSPNGALQRGAAGIGRVRPGHGGGPHQTGPEPDCQGTVPTRVTIKQESLDQEYLDDVNDIISNDLVVHEDDQ